MRADPGRSVYGEIYKTAGEGENEIIKGMKILAVGSLTHNMDLVENKYNRLGIKRVNHGGMWESSMFMACNPEFVSPEKIKNAIPTPSQMRDAESYGQESIVNYEEISKASTEFGESLIQTAAKRIAEEALAALHDQNL